MISKKNSVLILILFISVIGIISVKSTEQVSPNIKPKINTNSETSVLSNTVMIFILNQHKLYSDDHISTIDLYVNTILKNKYPSITFNTTVIDDPSVIISNFIDDFINSTNVNQVVLIGSIGPSQVDLFNKILTPWGIRNSSLNINHFALIDYKILIDPTVYPNVTFVSFDMLQAGFMSGVKSATITTSNKIGLMLDSSNEISFNSKLKSKNFFNNEHFISGFISGVNFASEHILDNTEILIRTEIFNDTQNSQTEMVTKLKKFTDFGVDAVFNMQSSFDDIFIEESNKLGLKTGILGDQNNNADFSFVQNTHLALDFVLQNWNSSEGHSIGNNWHFDLNNNSYFSLSELNVTDESPMSINTVQNMLLNGSITLSPILVNPEIISGFTIEFWYLIVLTPIYISRKKSNRK